jgi:hypothetical protein
MIIIDIKSLKHNPSKVRGLSVDYATNSLNGFIDEKEVILFFFKDLGIRLDNRYMGHSVELEEDEVKIICSF